MAKDEKKSKANPLTGMAAALAKAGVLSEKAARELVREQRREDKELGRDAVAEREAARLAEAEARRKAEAEAARARERERVGHEALERARRVTEENLHAGGEGGPRRWFYVARDGRVPFLEVTDEASRLLAEGKAGVVELQDEAGRVVRHVVVAGEKHLVTLVGIDKDRVRFWNRDGEARA